MHSFADQLGRTIELRGTPKRIISLVPSQTELLSDLGLEDEVIGITKFCVHPSECFRSKSKIGGTKQIHIEKIRELKPDLVIANKEENVQEQIELIAREFPVWVSDVNTVDDAFKLIDSIGMMTGRKTGSDKIIASIRNNFHNLHNNHPGIKTCYLIWKDPYMTVGGDTFINHMLIHAGFENIFADKKRYPEISLDQLLQSHCRLLLLSTEPYPFKEKHIEELRRFLPGIKILLADGEMFSWYGSRLIKAPAYFEQLQNQILSLTDAGDR